MATKKQVEPAKKNIKKAQKPGRRRCIASAL